jgi:hypothetical protein
MRCLWLWLSIVRAFRHGCLSSGLPHQSKVQAQPFSPCLITRKPKYSVAAFDPTEWVMLASMTTRFVVLSFLAWFAACGQAAAIECPWAGLDTYVLSPSQKRLLTKGTYIDLVNEIDEMSASLKTQKPDISYPGLVDAIITAYCPVVADLPSLSEQEKRDDVRKFSDIVMKQLSWDLAPQASAILAHVELSPEVYRSLREKADAAGQTPSQYMAALLTKAAGAHDGQ